MLIGISGTASSGKTQVARYLTFQGFTLIGIKRTENEGKDDSNVESSEQENGSVYQSSMDCIMFNDVDELMEYVTMRWTSHFVISNVESIEVLTKLQGRPFFLHLSVDAPLKLRYERYKIKTNTSLTLEEFVDNCDSVLYSTKDPLVQINNQANVKVVNTSNSIKNLFIKLSELNLLDQSRLRPTWDSYFMRLADLAALRSNCMKRRVGCVIVRGNRVVATGYNGTPRHLPNCNEGGCERCNKGQGSGAALSTCLCLHAEENALLESGRDRITGGAGNESSVLYCNTCPCLTCSIKIVQSGIKEVVYAQSYSMDVQTHKVMKSASIVLRQFSPPTDGIFI